MATDRRRALRLLAALPALLVLAHPHIAAADSAWWQPLAFAGQRITAVSVAQGRLTIDRPDGHSVSSDGGRTFAPTSDPATASLPLHTTRAVWDIRSGVVVTAAQLGPTSIPVYHPDPSAPYLGAGAHLLAAPAALPGVVIAVGSDNHVWRRAPSGSWSTAFVLLPAGGFAGTPTVTSLASFSEPLSVAVYMGVDGYGVLLTEDGGDDWIRADPGLPEHVLGLATDPAAKALYAATDSGLYVHHLQSFPAPPVYVDAALSLRWLGIAVVALVATAGALLGLRRVTPAPDRSGSRRPPA